MIDRLISYLAPHYCTSCGEIGAILCSNCKYDIISEPYQQCLICAKPTAHSAICKICNTHITRAWCIGERTGGLQRLLDSYKFQRAIEGAKACAQLLDQRLPELGDVRIVAVPTIPAHIRQRGYDHAALIAKQFARIRNLPYDACLVRKGFHQQRGSSKSTRARQAAEAFAAKGVQADAVYLLIDDIVTTGSTVDNAARVLKAAGASEVWVAVIARQMLSEDK